MGCVPFFSFLPIQAGSAFPDQQFADLAKSCNVPTAVIDVLAAEWNIALFAFICTDVNDLSYTLTEAGVPEGELQANRTIASLRLLWTKCKAAVAPGAPSAHAVSGPPPSLDTGGSWSDTFPPKLGDSVVRSLRDTFESAYPSELLDADCFPSARLLALVHRQLASKDWRYIFWRLRLSQRMEDDHRAGPVRSSKLELADLLLDDVPTREVPALTLGLFQLGQILSLHSVAIALCKGAHFATLKTFDRAFLKLAGARYAADSGMRAPTAEEMQTADRTIWEQVGGLLSKDWSLDDALHEVVEVRCTLSSLLQPRPAPLRSFLSANAMPRRAPPPTKGRAKGKQGQGPQQEPGSCEASLGYFL